MADSDPSSGAADPRATGRLGELLRSARVAQDLTVEQISAELRIEARQLTALEENRFEQIGVPVFVKGYLRQYGHRLGVNVSDLLALYYKQATLTEVQIQPNRTIKLRDEQQVTTWILASIVLITLVVGFAVWWWSDGSFGIELPAPGATSTSTSQPSATTAAPSAVTAPAPSESPPAAPAAASPQASVSDGASAPPAAAPAGRSPAAAEGSDDADDREPPRGAANANATVPLELAFAGDSWAEITDARGERLLYGLSLAGRRVTLRGEPPFAVVLGNANAVSLRVDGERYPIPTTGRQDNLVRFAVDVAEE